MSSITLTARPFGLAAALALTAGLSLPHAAAAPKLPSVRGDWQGTAISDETGQEFRVTLHIDSDRLTGSVRGLSGRGTYRKNGKQELTGYVFYNEDDQPACVINLSGGGKPRVGIGLAFSNRNRTLTGKFNLTRPGGPTLDKGTITLDKR